MAHLRRHLYLRPPVMLMRLMLVYYATLSLVSGRGLRCVLLCWHWLLGIHRCCKQRQGYRGHQANHQLLGVHHHSPFRAPSPLVGPPALALHVSRSPARLPLLLYCRGEAASSAATVRQGPQRGVKAGSSFVQDGLLRVFVIV